MPWPQGASPDSPRHSVGFAAPPPREEFPHTRADSTRARQSRLGRNTQRNDAPAPPRCPPTSPGRGARCAPLRVALPPPAPPPGPAAYLNSWPRRDPARRPPHGDIRAPGWGSRPHLPAPAAAGEAPRPARGRERGVVALPGGSPTPHPQPRGGSSPALAPDPGGGHSFSRRTLASRSRREKRERRRRKGDRGTRLPTSSAACDPACLQHPRSASLGPQGTRPPPRWESPGRAPGAPDGHNSFQVWPSEQRRLRLVPLVPSL